MLVMLRYRNIVLSCLLLSLALVICWIVLVKVPKQCKTETKPIISHAPTTVVSFLNVMKDIANKEEKSEKELFYDKLIDFEEKSEKELSYDKLIDYVLHPKSYCRTQVALGGLLYSDGSEDGDKKICLKPGKPLSKDCIVLSAGVGNEWSFEETIRQVFNCNVYAFDPSLNMVDHMHSEGIWFFNKGISDIDGTIIVSNNTWQMSKFDTILSDLKLENRTIDVFKMDIEGGEYSVLKDMLDKGFFGRVNHFCLEVHFDNEMDWDATLQLLRDIEEKAELLHFSSRNNSMMPLLQVPGLPHRREQLFYEMAWMRRDMN